MYGQHVTQAFLGNRPPNLEIVQNKTATGNKRNSRKQAQTQETLTTLSLTPIKHLPKKQKECFGKGETKKRKRYTTDLTEKVEILEKNHGVGVFSTLPPTHLETVPQVITTRWGRGRAETNDLVSQRTKTRRTRPRYK